MSVYSYIVPIDTNAGTEVVAGVNGARRHPQCFSETQLPEGLTATTDPTEATAGVNFIVHAVPVQQSAAFLTKMAPHIPSDVPVISTSKGIDTESLGTMADVISSALGPAHPCAFLSGPSFAKELVEAQPTGLVLASSDSAVAKAAVPLFLSGSLRVYISDDVTGVELGGALKNVYAIIAGACEGMNFGLNPVALLVTRACREMARILSAKSARPDTVHGLSGVGDLMLTCFGSASRNRTVGLRLGRGESIDHILATSAEVAEGVATTPAAARLARQLGVDAPCIFAMEAVLDGRIGPREALEKVMSRPAKESELI